LHTGRIVPIYPSTENLKTNGFNSRFFRKIIYTVLSEANQYITEPFDEDMLNRLQCMPLSQAIECIHFPSSMDEAYNARKRLAFNELSFCNTICIFHDSISDRQINNINQ
jgi:ATP-dependent DNA helicase RecG